MSERLHLTWQASAAGALGACLPAGSQVYCTRDPLSFGHLFSTASLEAWTVRRAEWLRRERDDRPELVGEAFEPSYAGLPEALEEAGEVSVWVGNTLNDELFVCRCASLVELGGLAPGAWTLRRFSGDQSDARDVCPLGGMSPEDVEELPEQPFSRELRETALAGWRALTSDSPADLVDFLDRTQDLEMPGSHLEPLTGYFPAASTGLDVWEEALVANIAERGDKPLRAMGRAISEQVNGRDLPEEAHLVVRLLDLSDHRLDDPLVRLTGTLESMQSLDFEVTDLGRRVLEGEANRLDICGLDRWIGGAHLDSEDAASLWWRTPEGLRRELDTTPNDGPPQPRATPSVDTIRVAEFQGHEELISFTIHFEDGDGDLRHIDIRLSWPEPSPEADGYESKYAWRLDDADDWSTRKWIGATRWRTLTEAINELYVHCEDRLMVEGVRPDNQRCYRRDPTEHDVEAVTLEVLFGGALNPLLRE